MGFCTFEEAKLPVISWIIWIWLCFGRLDDNIETWNLMLSIYGGNLLLLCCFKWECNWILDKYWRCLNYLWCVLASNSKLLS